MLFRSTLRELGKAMTYTHRYADANKLFQDVIQNDGKSAGQGNPWSVWYAFACVAATAGHTDDAFQFLNEASKRGYANAEALAADEDLQSLRRDSRFQQLVTSLKHPAAGLQTH